MTTVADKVPFGDLCKLCEKVSGQPDRAKKRRLLSDYIAYWRDGGDGGDDSFFPAMRLLLPQFDRDRPAYGIKEATLARLYIDVLALQDSPDAQQLLHYKAPQVVRAGAEDFASVAYLVLRHRCPTKGSLSVAEVNALLDRVSAAHAIGGPEGGRAVRDALCSLLRNTSAMEQKWLVRMILRDLRTGLSTVTVLSCYHPDAQDLFDVTSSLARVCRDLRDPNLRQHEAQVALFSPVHPMLAERAEPRTVERRLAREAFFAETKFDGERLQVHKKGGEFRYFTRNSHDYSAGFGSLTDRGSLTQFISSAFRSHVSNCILDGEVVAYDPVRKNFVCKGSNVDVKSLREDSSLQPCFVAFDILFLNDRVVTNCPLEERAKLLDSALTEVPGRIQISRRQKGSTQEDAVRFLNESIERLEEGVVLKSVSSVYKPNSRKAGWLKLKPEYVDSLVSDLDLLVIGGYFGEGRRGGDVSHFLLGVASDERAEDGTPVCFWSVAKVGSGYSDSELEQLRSRLTPKWKVYDPRKPPERVVLAPGHKEKPDLYVEPRDSVVLQVKASELTRSAQFRTGITLRFPRVSAVRYDKPWHDALSFADLTELDRVAGGKLATTALGDDGSLAKRTRLSVPTIAPHFRPADLSKTLTKLNVLDGKEICVVTGCGERSKQGLERIVVESGGTPVQNPREGTFCVVAEKINFKVSNLVQKKLWDVVKAERFLVCLEAQRLDLWEPRDLLARSADTERRLEAAFDEWGDSYTAPVTAGSLRNLFEAIPADKCAAVAPSVGFMARFERENFGSVPSWGVFRNHRFYFEGAGSRLNKAVVRLHGGKVEEKIGTEEEREATDAPVVPESATARRGLRVVEPSWIEACIDAGQVV
ncbi:hypothetical protein HPB47_003677 [Ixodes persulcatus]|uniref:Uncharacterized protein n=1 Tax=Ixodes persulcatus TaxID=34615 RepID=A0AC60PIU7_IXOPE|nr:hypothetical protein HPB47_003677 [Ixodes persulcatus]